MRAISVCVEYDDILRLTLPTWLPHFDDILIVTAPDDVRTQEVCRDIGARCHTTNVFYERGAAFNKGAAMEDGFDRLPRTGWICVLDADIVLPRDMPLVNLHSQYLHTPRRRTIDNPADWNGSENWKGFSYVPDGEPAGYFQLFHADADALKQHPWYATHFRSAASCDSDFMWKFAPYHKWLPFDVLHLGPTGSNWCGRTTRRLNGEMPAGAEQRADERNRIVEARLAGRREEEMLL